MTHRILRAIASTRPLKSRVLPGTLYRLRARVLRAYWTAERVHSFLDARIPRLGCVNGPTLTSELRALGAQHSEIIAARKMLDLHAWDGDGHHLTMWRRVGSVDFRHWTQDPRWVEANPREAARWGVAIGGSKGHPVTIGGPAAGFTRG